MKNLLSVLLLRTAWVGLVIASVLLLLSGCGPKSSDMGRVRPPESAPAHPLFEDVTAQAGITFSIQHKKHPFTIRESTGYGAAFIDYDADGLPDIVLLGPDAIQVYHNEGNWHFTNVTTRMGLRQGGFWQGIAVGDYDNDGYPDLYVCGYNCSALYHNEKGRGFREVTQEAGLAVSPPDKSGTPEWRSSAAFVDVDQDGKLDLYVGRYLRFGPHDTQTCGTGVDKVACTPEIYKSQHGSLYHNLGQGRFRDETRERGLDKVTGNTLGIAIGDYNNDGNIDIAVANDEVSGNLFENLGKGYFREVGVESGTAYDNIGRAHGGMGIDFADYDNDGKLDLFITTYENEIKCLYRNVGMGLFANATQLAGLERGMQPYVGWGVKFLDYDNDGRLDLMEVNGHVMDNVEVLGKGGHFQQPMLLFHQEPDGTFADVSSVAGSAFQTQLAGRALCVGDLDNDGRPDVLVSNVEGKPMLLRCVCATTNHWLGLQLVGKTSNRMGIGSTVNIQAGGKKQMRVCSTTGSTLSAHDPRLLFGLGANASAQSVTVRWPSGRTSAYTNVRADSYYSVTEGAAQLTPISAPRPILSAAQSPIGRAP